MTDDHTQPGKPANTDAASEEPSEYQVIEPATVGGETRPETPIASEVTEPGSGEALAVETTEIPAADDQGQDAELGDTEVVSTETTTLGEPQVLRPVETGHSSEYRSDPDSHTESTSTVPSGGDGFKWHPVYRGRTFNDVLTALTEDIARDQRTYELAMAGAEGAEHDALKSVVDLERRWSPYDFDWVEADPGVLAGKILAFEKDREQRQELRTFAEYRSTGALQQPVPTTPAAPARSLPIIPIGVAVLVVLILVFILFAVR